MYSITGIGDRLALFRCMSCQYHFTTDILCPSELGAVGRVYTTLQVAASVLSIAVSCPRLGKRLHGSDIFWFK